VRYSRAVVSTIDSATGRVVSKENAEGIQEKPEKQRRVSHSCAHTQPCCFPACLNCDTYARPLGNMCSVGCADSLVLIHGELLDMTSVGVGGYRL
jgi:hypothetical protein